MHAPTRKHVSAAGPRGTSYSPNLRTPGHWHELGREEQVRETCFAATAGTGDSGEPGPAASGRVADHADSRAPAARARCLCTHTRTGQAVADRDPAGGHHPLGPASRPPPRE
jgi:hypothetical protein